MRFQTIARPSILLALLFSPLFCCAQGIEASIVPHELFVGDEAVLTYMEENISLPALYSSLEPGASDPPAIELPRGLLPADSSNLSVKKARIIPLQGRKDAALCEITFVPWKAGEIVIPSLALAADGSIRSQAVRVSVSSLAQRYGATALMPNRPPLLPPGTIYLLYALILCLAALCFFAGLAAKRLLARAKAPRRTPARKVRREFARRIKAQRRRIGKDRALWYAEFSALARLFFYRMTEERKYLAADARDIARFLEAAKSTGGEAAQGAERLVAALYEIERMRFSGESAAEGAGGRESCFLAAFEDFVLLACSAPEALFGSRGKSAAPHCRKGKAHAVV